MCYSHLLQYIIPRVVYVCNLIQNHLSFITILPPPTGPETSIAASQRWARREKKKRGGKNRNSEDPSCHTWSKCPRGKKGQGKNKTHYYVYMVGSEKVDSNTRGHAAGSEERGTQKARTNEEHHQGVTQWVIKGRGRGRCRSRSSIPKGRSGSTTWKK